MKLKIGIDFDNTIITYDEVFHRYALNRGWIGREVHTFKHAIREEVRKNFGNDRWIWLQSEVYTTGMREAQLAEGVMNFLVWAKQQKIPFFIISHKTEFAAIDPKKDLRTPAFQWMKHHHFFSPESLDLKIGTNIFFESFLQDKLKRMVECRLTHFIDDLEEVLVDDSFPAGVTRLHYNPSGEHSHDDRVHRFLSWFEISNYFKGLIDAHS